MSERQVKRFRREYRKTAPSIAGPEGHEPTIDMSGLRRARRDASRPVFAGCAPPPHHMLAVGPVGAVSARDTARNAVRGLSVTAAAKSLGVSHRVARGLVGPDFRGMVRALTTAVLP